MNSCVKEKDLIGHTIQEISIVRNSEITWTGFCTEYNDGLICIKTDKDYFYGKFKCMISGRYGKFYLLDHNRKNMENALNIKIKQIKKIYIGKKIIGCLLKTDYKFYEITDINNKVYHLNVYNLYK